MPRYEYRCNVCDATFEQRRPMSESADVATCPSGHPGAKRLLSVFSAASATASPPAAPPAPCGGSCACYLG
ncbi:FmdB family zinc ribbon protein [Rhabdothermincola sediminis]|uniref:FmdB family zinc ribbon protein n=1 Tax=Rhabdothermincola sediminis TaxID=2751370 RepID=UPI001AA080A4|nr:zinc ribbon domain-containing protein [Rhabdothermincola sediminis]